MRICMLPGRLYVIFRFARDGRPALGFKIKLAKHMTWSERSGRNRSLRIGPIYVGTYAPTTSHRAGQQGE